MKMTLWIFFTLFVVSVANADDYGVYGYGYWMPKMIHDYLDIVDHNAPVEGPQKCENVYAKAMDKGVLDIRYALGYFDDTTGEERIHNGVNYGLSPSLDIEVFNSLRKELTSPCRTKTMRVCGFEQNGEPLTGKVVLQKNINLHGKKTLVRITLTQASATPNFEQNKGIASDRQQILTAQSEENFFEGLKSADIVLYNGHSRNGGGPDFNPPRLMSNLHVDYKGYYEKKRPGILRVMASLKENPDKEIILGLFSCYSKKHFYDTFMKANPIQRLILSADTIDYFDTLKASIGYLEGFLRGSCGQDLADTAKQEDKLKQGFESYNIN